MNLTKNKYGKRQTEMWSSNIPQLKAEIIYFDKGYDVATPALAMDVGSCREAQNFTQDINGGYETISGYERYDGQASPSEAAYSVLMASVTGVSLGDVLTDNAGTSYGTVIALPTDQVILTKVTGTFTTGNVKVGGVVKGTCVGGQIIDGADTPILRAQYKNLAADVYRADITAVPGSGSVLGVVTYKDVQYAFRNNAGGTAIDMYKSSTAGWVQVDLGFELEFTSGGTFVVTAGMTIEGEISGATAVVTRVVHETGTFAGADATGRFIFASQTGTFQSETLKVGADLDVATISADSSAITFAIPGGNFEFEIANFGGSITTTRLYGCDGLNRGFEFDGTVFVPINTGMTTDAPVHVIAHQNHLFFSFLGSVQHSSLGFPYQWTPLTGAGEIALGDDVTGFMSQPGDADTATLIIFTRNSIGILYGTGAASWALVHFKKGAGALPYTIQQTAGFILMLDDRGITTLGTTEKYGNFEESAISKKVLPWLTTKLTSVLSSCVIREKNQYCLFFSDNSGLYVTLDNESVSGMMPVMFSHTVECIDVRETSSGNEVGFFGDSDGYVYQMEKGTSFDGEDIEAYFTLAFNSSKNSTQIKRYRKSTLELEGEGYYEFKFGYYLDYSSAYTAQPIDQDVTTSLSGENWDEFTWDSFFWDGVSLSPIYLDMTGSGVNVSLRVYSKGDYYNKTRFGSAILQYTIMKNKR